MLHALGAHMMYWAIEQAAPARAKWLATRCAHEPAETVTRRSHTLATLAAMSKRLEPHRAAWRARLPGDSHSRDLNFPLIHIIAATLGYEDTAFAHDLAHGMPIAGVIPSAGALPTRVMPATRTEEEWMAGIPQRNEAVVNRIRAEQGSELARERWGPRYGRGHRRLGYGTHVHYTGDATLIRAYPELRHWRGKRGPRKKIRLTGDFRCSGINDIV